MELQKDQGQNKQDSLDSAKNKPDETSGLLIEAHLKIWDPETQEELVNVRS